MDKDNQTPEDQPKEAKAEVIPAETPAMPGMTRFARSNDITPVFNSSAEAVERLTSFVEALAPASAPTIFDQLNLLSGTDAFHRLRRQACDGMINAMRESDDFMKAAAQWHEMDADSRVNMLNRISALQGRAFGFDAPRVVPFYERPDGNDIFHGRFNPQLDVNGVLEVNIHPNSKFNSFPTALEMVLTQNSLAWLDNMADDFDHGLVSEGNPLFEQARLFSVYRGIMNVVSEANAGATELGGLVGNASADMAEGISLEIVTGALQGTHYDLRRHPAAPKQKGIQPG